MGEVAAAVIIVGSDPEFGAKLAPLLTERGYEVVCADPTCDPTELAVQRQAVVVVLGPSVPVETMLATAQRFSDMESRPEVVAVGAAVDTELMRRAMRAGVHDMLCVGEQTWADITAAVDDAAKEVLGRRVEAAEPAEAGGRIIAVMGTKGGVGKSVVATNLAACMAAAGRNVVLVDLDLHSGDTGIMLSLEPVHTIRDAAIASDRLDESMLGGLLTAHGCGARVLLAPARPEDCDVISATRVAKILALLAGMADEVVVDTPSAWDETTLAAVDASDRILAITGMDVPSIKNTAVMLSRLKQLGRLNGNLQVVLNRADSKVLIEEKEVEKALGHSVSVRVPSDRAVPRSVNKGVPIVIEAPRSAVAKALAGLSAGLSTNGV